MYNTRFWFTSVFCYGGGGGIVGIVVVVVAAAIDVAVAVVAAAALAWQTGESAKDPRIPRSQRDGSSASHRRRETLPRACRGRKSARAQ